MSSTHKIQCRCGQIRGLLKATRPSNRCVCYCSDCQAFARHLQAPDVLDHSGGTDIVQVPSSNLTFTQGAEKLACIRLTDKGMLRWYSTCCQTPIGNTPANWKVSFVGLIHTCLSGENQSLDTAFGQVFMRVGVENAIGPNKPVASGLLCGMAKFLEIFVKGRLGGAYRKGPFFDPQTGAPVAKPNILSAGELTAAKSAA
ncbi:MAG: hypothetical protein KKB08_18085 [Gammaproteobacteria bacterium]|jgi:hypothetical protein|nr:hypothetical protein [Gammaproteobacteria bacterium]MBU1818654.1 hypothetical protein [Gammaproteobacteria bacterium]